MQLKSVFKYLKKGVEKRNFKPHEKADEVAHGSNILYFHMGNFEIIGNWGIPNKNKT